MANKKFIVSTYKLQQVCIARDPQNVMVTVTSCHWLVFSVVIGCQIAFKK